MAEDSGSKEEVPAAFLEEVPSELRGGGRIGINEVRRKEKYCRGREQALSVRVRSGDGGQPARGAHFSNKREKGDCGSLNWGSAVELGERKFLEAWEEAEPQHTATDGTWAGPCAGDRAWRRSHSLGWGPQGQEDI